MLPLSYIQIGDEDGGFCHDYGLVGHRSPGAKIVFDIDCQDDCMRKSNDCMRNK